MKMEHAYGCTLLYMTSNTSSAQSVNGQTCSVERTRGGLHGSMRLYASQPPSDSICQSRTSSSLLNHMLEGVENCSFHVPYIPNKVMANALCKSADAYGKDAERGTSYFAQTNRRSVSQGVHEGKMSDAGDHIPGVSTI